MDERLRKLEELASTGDLSAQIQFLDELERSHELPEELLSFINLVAPNYRFNYYAIINFLKSSGIPFEFRPRQFCTCENTACIETNDHPLLKEYGYCEECHQELFPTPNGALCTNSHCTLYHEQQYTIGECKRVAWRAYEDMLGGLCDICMSRMPLSYHSTICNCPTCGTGTQIGPYILLRARLISPNELLKLEASYRYVFNDHRTITQPFISALNYSPEMEREEKGISVMDFIMNQLMNYIKDDETRAIFMISECA
jgi:hypothetical protein